MKFILALSLFLSVALYAQETDKEVTFYTLNKTSVDVYIQPTDSILTLAEEFNLVIGDTLRRSWITYEYEYGKCVFSQCHCETIRITKQINETDFKYMPVLCN